MQQFGAIAFITLLYLCTGANCVQAVPDIIDVKDLESDFSDYFDDSLSNSPLPPFPTLHDVFPMEDDDSPIPTDFLSNEYFEAVYQYSQRLPSLKLGGTEKSDRLGNFELQLCSQGSPPMSDKPLEGRTNFAGSMSPGDHLSQSWSSACSNRSASPLEYGSVPFPSSVVPLRRYTDGMITPGYDVFPIQSEVTNEISGHHRTNSEPGMACMPEPTSSSILNILYPNRLSHSYQDPDAEIVAMLEEMTSETNPHPTNEFTPSCKQEVIHFEHLNKTYENIGAYRHDVSAEMVKEVASAATRLNISINPQVWTVTDVQQWLYNWLKLEDTALQTWLMNGSQLCQIHSEGYKVRCPSTSTYVQRHLELWIAAYRHISQTENSDLVRSCPETHADTENKPQASCSTNLVPLAESGKPSTSGTAEYEFESIKIGGGYGMKRYSGIQLWQFIVKLLEDPKHYSDVVCWSPREDGIFKVENSKKLAKLWGEQKNKDTMNYDKLSRSLRQYYLKKILRKTSRPQRLLYQFVKPYPFLDSVSGASD